MCNLVFWRQNQEDHRFKSNATLYKKILLNNKQGHLEIISVGGVCAAAQGPKFHPQHWKKQNVIFYIVWSELYLVQKRKKSIQISFLQKRIKWNLISNQEVANTEHHIKYPFQIKWTLCFSKNVQSETWPTALLLIFKSDNTKGLWAHYILPSNLITS